MHILQKKKKKWWKIQKRSYQKLNDTIIQFLILIETIESNNNLDLLKLIDTTALKLIWMKIII